MIRLIRMSIYGREHTGIMQSTNVLISILFSCESGSSASNTVVYGTEKACRSGSGRLGLVDLTLMAYETVGAGESLLPLATSCFTLVWASVFVHMSSNIDQNLELRARIMGSSPPFPSSAEGHVMALIFIVARQLSIIIAHRCGFVLIGVL